MKSFALIIMSATLWSGISAQELKPIQLNAPDKTKGMNIMKALELRSSVRDFSETRLTLQELSDLVWAANGINRPEKSGRTAPSSMNAQDVDVYAIMAEGAFVYDFKQHALNPVAAGDHRKLVADRQPEMAVAPVMLVLVSDLSRLKDKDENIRMTKACMDVGTVSQNISLFCSGTGLVTVPRASMNQEELRKVLQLKETQKMIMNHPVGYQK
ncbi:MAG: SagB/ThcOx family dehydrogenase [Bacteroidota bacterium]